MVPTTDDSLCTGASCCNSNYRASPYRLQHLNSSLMNLGGSLFTTFYMKVVSDSQACSQYSGPNNCCTANISTIWLDVGEQEGRGGESEWGRDLGRWEGRRAQHGE